MDNINVKFRFEKIKTIIFIVLGVLFLITFYYSFLKKNNSFEKRTHNSYPKLQRRNALTEEQIEKILNRIKKNLKSS